MKRSSLLIALALVFLTSAVALAQTDPAIGYPNFNATDIQTRSIPAGTVGDPGSHLTYVINTGVNARDIFGPAIEDADSTPLVDLAEFLDKDGNGQLDADGIYQNFISITNTHPTAAVTVHFRYYNDNCDDLLDFLVVVTCNDTLIFDPFNFEIPGTGGVNTRERMIGPGSGVLDPIATTLWGSGRFVITAAASGTSIDADTDSDILFPYEMRALSGDCNIFHDDSDVVPFDNASQQDTLLGYYASDDDDARIGNVGIRGGLVADNLHVFNASQISFNYLIGHYTTAEPSVPGLDQVSWGHPAWARPAIDAIGDAGDDGDASQALTGYLVLGSELGYASNLTTRITDTDFFYLRNEVHGGDINAAATNGGFSLYGALGTLPLHITPTTDQIIHLLSVADDYNGSNNAGVTGFPDRAANISPAFTTYVLQIYDNDEHLLQIAEDIPINVSPPRPGATLDLKAVCFCLRTFLTSTISETTNVDDITIADMVTHFGTRVLTGEGDFTGLLKTAPPDQSGGWIRFVRDNSEQILVTDYTQEVDEAIGGPFGTAVAASGPGTATVDSTLYADDTLVPSFLTLGDYILKFEGFGASWFLQAVAQDPAVSEDGDPGAASDIVVP